MGQLRPRAWLIPAIVLVAIAAGSIAASATVLTAGSTASAADAAGSSADSSLLASCTASPTDVNIGETVTLDASNSDTSSLDFDLDGDGTYEVTDTTNFVQTTSYFEGGQFYEPIVRDTDGLTDSCGSVYVNANPEADFTFSPDPGIEGQPVEFDASSSIDSDGEIARYHWDWNGDELIDETTTEPVVNHTFFETGFRTVGLTVEDDDGSNATTYRDVEIVEANVIARCSVEPTTAVVGQNVTIDARDSENATYLGYEFGDGTSLPETIDFRVNHSYAEPGEYTPVITVYGPNGKSDRTECPTVTVEPENAPPEPSFTWQPDPGLEGQPVAFDASASTDPDGSITTYYWDWNGDELIDETTTEPVVNHTFFETGFRSVGLTVQDDAGANATLYRDVDVVPETVARCTVEPTQIAPGEGVLIDASNTESGSYLDYDFDGDGEYDRFERREFAAEHVYEEPGTYTPTVRVYGPGGQRDVAECGEVTVNQPPEPDFTWQPDPGIAGQSMTFDAAGSTDPDGEIRRYEWDFNSDGVYEESTAEPRIGQTYFGAGFKTVELRVVDDQNATGTAVRDVEVVQANVVARCRVEPTTVEVGQPVTIDASESENASYLDYDYDGNEVYDLFETDQFRQEHVYEEPGEYAPVIRVYGTGERDIEECGTVTVEPENEPPEASFTSSPNPGIAGQTVTFDASDSVDPDGTIEIYRWDFNGDGTYDETTSGPEIEHTFASTGFRTVGLQVVDDEAATGEAVRDVEIVEPRLTVRCTVEPSSVEPGENVTIQVEAPNGSYLDYDFDGDGEYDRFERTTFTATTSYNESGEYTPVVRVYSGLGSREVVECDPVTVEEPDESGLPIPPWWPIPAAGGGLLGLGGLGYYLFGGGGGAGGGRPTPKPKPRPQGTKEGTRYETGVFEIPSDSGALSVPVGFEPDLILFSAANGARTDTATDRTAGWSRGVASWTDEGIENQCLTVADDAHNTDQATCAADDDLALQIVRHEANGPPGRVTLRVTDTTSDGFGLDVSVPGDDPLAGGIRVLYQAFRTGSDVDAEVGTVMTPTEPGTQTVELGIEADHVSLATTAAVSDTDQLWTTDRGVGFSVGHAVAEPEMPISQAVAGTSAWPGSGHPVAGVADDAAALHLLYQDGDKLAGRTSARATAIGQTLRLQYDRVYNGPHKLGSTARHPISYLALSGGEQLRPAVGTFSLPQPGETQSIDCGFEPALIECQIAPAPLGEEVATAATPHPFGASQGTAIATGDRLRQYVLHHAVVPDGPDARPSMSAAGGGAGQVSASTDGGRSTGPMDDVQIDASEMPETGDQAVSGRPATGSGDQGTTEMTDVQPRDPETGAAAEADPETATAPAAAEHDDDGRIGLWLATDSEGTIVGRDELQVAGITERGFQATVESVDTDRRASTGPRPTVVYRAWPALDVTGSAREQSQAQQTGQPPAESKARATTGAQTGRTPTRSEQGSETPEETTPGGTRLDPTADQVRDADLGGKHTDTNPEEQR